MAITFDTLKFVETLEDAGVDRKQASAMATAVRESQESADVATKADIMRLDAKIDLVRSELSGQINLARRDTIIWLCGALIVGFGTVIGLLLK